MLSWRALPKFHGSKFFWVFFWWGWGGGRGGALAKASILLSALLMIRNRRHVQRQSAWRQLSKKVNENMYQMRFPNASIIEDLSSCTKMVCDYQTKEETGFENSKSEENLFHNVQNLMKMKSSILCKRRSTLESGNGLWQYIVKQKHVINSCAVQLRHKSSNSLCEE